MTEDFLYQSLTNQITEVRGKVDALDKDLGTLRTEVVSLRADVGGLRSSVADIDKQLGGIQSGIKAIAWVLGLGTLFVLGLAGLAGKSVIRDIAREVVDEQIAKVQSFSQVGRFTSANRLIEAPGEFPVYRWPLSSPIDPSSVIAVTAEPMEFVGPMAVTARLGPDGQDCLMTVRASPDVIEDVEMRGIEAKVTIIYRGS